MTIRGGALAVLLALGLGAVLIISGCGGGGGGAAAPGPGAASVLTETNAGPAAGAVVTSLQLVTRPNYVGAASLGSPVAAQGGFLPSLLRRALDRPKNGGPAVMGTGSVKSNCSGGGTKQKDSRWDGSDTDPQNYSATITYQSCVEGTETWSGVVTAAYTGSLAAPQKVTTSLTLVYADTLAGDNLSITNGSISYSDIVYVADTAVGASVAISGKIDGRVASKQFSADMSGFVVSYRFEGPATRFKVGGVLKPACASAALTATTKKDIVIRSGDTCPSDGDMTVSAGSDAAELVFSADKKVSALFNGKLVAAYGSCAEVGGLCL
ncbi:MAG: hypothetical protein M0Z79_01250 [Nitrospiraceae bacterium]|nr:hypothetical protein [Nitrospiraceae bacterium]